MSSSTGGDAVPGTVELLGSQRATTRVLPSGRVDRDALVLADALSFPLDPWQGEVVTEAARTRGSKWSAFEVCAIVPRQNGKSYLVVIRALAGILLWGEQLVIYSAHEYRTAQETWRLMRDVCESDAMARHVRRIRTMAGGEVIEFHNGARFKMMARTRTSGRGFSPDCILLDEAFALSADVMAALIPSVAARPNPQVWYLSSAGTYESEVLLGLRRRGHSGRADRMAYWEWHADETVDHRDPRIHAATNPAYGRRLFADGVERELVSMSRRSFMRERLGVWSETAAETVLDEEAVNRLTVPVPPPPTDGRPIGWGVDAAWDRSGAALCAAYHGDDGRAVLVPVDARPGAGWLPDRLGEISSAYEPRGVAYDARGNILDLMERAARDHDVELLPMKYGDYPSACANLAQRVAEGTVTFAAVPALVADAVAATSAPTGSGWVWSRKTATPPTQLIAATAALWSLEHDDGAGVAVY
jgi:hypothetical protein